MPLPKKKRERKEKYLHISTSGNEYITAEWGIFFCTKYKCGLE